MRILGRKRKSQVVVEQPTPIFHIPTDYRKPKAEIISFPRKLNALARIGLLASGAAAAVTGLTIR